MERGKLVSVGLVLILTMIFFLLFLYDSYYIVLIIMFLLSLYDTYYNYNFNYLIDNNKWIYDSIKNFPQSQEDINCFISSYQNRPTEKSGLSSHIS